MGFGGEAWGKRPLGRSRRRWEDDFKKDVKIGWKGVDWICVARETDMQWTGRDRGNELSGTLKGGEFLGNQGPVVFFFKAPDLGS